MAAELFIGLMSGTSLDGVDGVLADLAEGRIAVWAQQRALPLHCGEELLALNRPEGAGPTNCTAQRSPATGSPTST